MPGKEIEKDYEDHQHPDDQGVEVSPSATHRRLFVAHDL